MAETNALQKQNANIAEQVIARIDKLCQEGFNMPKDYDYATAIRASQLRIMEIKDKNGRGVMECCTRESISSALFKMAVKGLDVSRNQGYMIVRGNTLCLDESYFGNQLQVKRIYPHWDAIVRIIYQDDIFATEIDVETGRMKLKVHDQKLENLDKDFIGAYMYLPCADGGKELYLMTKKMIVAAWAKSASNQGTHKQFPAKMIEKTVINSGCRKIINSTPSLASYSEENETTTMEAEEQSGEFEPMEFVEATEVKTVEVAPAVVETPKPKPQPKPQKEAPAPQEDLKPNSDFDF